MRAHRNAFSLIELMISISIAGMMSVVLFRSLFQINMTTNLSDKVMTVNEKAERLTQLFDHDLSGATTLVDNEPPKKLDVDMKKTSTADPQQQKQPKKDEEPEKKEAKPPKKIISKLFNSTNAGERLDMLTFISNNPMASYWVSKHGTESAGKPKPNLVRITYILKEDPENKGSFILTRQESVGLDWEKRSGKTYDVMTGIKDISVEYTAKIEKTVQIEEEKKQDPKAQQGQQQPQQPKQASKKPKTKTEVEYKTVKTWDMDQKEEQKEDDKKEDKGKGKEQVKQKPIPVLARITAKLFDNQLKTDVAFVFFVPIISDTEFAPKRRQGFQMPAFPTSQPAGAPGQAKGQPNTPPPPLKSQL